MLCPVRVISVLLFAATCFAEPALPAPTITSPAVAHGSLRAGRLPQEPPDNDTDVNARDKYGLTPLMRAARSYGADKIKKLLEQGADPNARNKTGRTALMLLSDWTQYDLIMGGLEEDHARSAGYLIDKGADINAQDEEGMTALMIAAGWEHYETLKTLLDRGADINLKDKKGRSALTWGARGWRKGRILPALLKKGARIEVADALMMGDSRKARALVQAGADLHVRGGYEDTVLMMAAENGDLGTVRALLKRSAEVNAQDRDGNTALMLAVAGRPSLGQTGRHWEEHGVQAGRTEIVQVLLAAGATINAKNKRGETALTWAIERGKNDSARILREAGADPKQKIALLRKACAK